MSRTRLALWLLLITPLGFASKLYHGPLESWVRNSAGGLLYVTFWMLVVACVWPRMAPLRIAASVLLATCALEALQLWHPSLLETVRGTFLGQAVLGSTFAWLDFPHYVVGAVLGWGILAGSANRPLERPGLA